MSERSTATMTGHCKDCTYWIERDQPAGVCGRIGYGPITSIRLASIGTKPGQALYTLPEFGCVLFKQQEDPMMDPETAYEIVSGLPFKGRRDERVAVAFDVLYALTKTTPTPAQGSLDATVPATTTTITGPDGTTPIATVGTGGRPAASTTGDGKPT